MPAEDIVSVGLAKPFLCNLVVVEIIKHVPRLLTLPKPLARDKDGIARTGLVQGPANRLKAVRDEMGAARMIATI